jgi:hypothetical protein
MRVHTSYRMYMFKTQTSPAPACCNKTASCGNPLQQRHTAVHPPRHWLVLHPTSAHTLLHPTSAHTLLHPTSAHTLQRRQQLQVPHLEQ